ncbi:MAG: ABC transporter permease [Terriglobia bacterium]
MKFSDHDSGLRRGRRKKARFMVSIARKNLFRDKLRFVIALVGIQFAVVLITIQAGVFLRFLVNASVLIDHAHADIWITARNLSNFEFGRAYSDKVYYQTQKVNGVAWAEKYILTFSLWKRPSGGQESVELVGFDPETMNGAPWRVIEGNIYDVKYLDQVMVDEADLARLGNPRVGDYIEIRGKKARIIGLTRGAKSFTQTPFVFTSFENTIRLSFLNRGQTVYVLVKVSPGYTVSDVQRRLQEVLPDNDVYTRQQFSNKSRRYWMVSTGAGLALLASALMGLVIGTIIVGQTIYASTIEHIKEFGTLKAIGASNADIYLIIIKQALINSVIGFSTGMIIAQGVIRLMRQGGLDVLMPWQMMTGIFAVTVMMCISSSFISIFKITRIDPALVFKS